MVITTNKIPEQLKECYFCRVRLKTKIPFEKDWTNKKYSYYQISKYLDKENYGVLCGYNNLIVIDFDDKEFQNKIVPLLPKTFTIQTANKRLFHKYYFCDNTESFKISDNEGKTLADVQGKGKMVVGPNSINDLNNYYEVIDSTPISCIHYDELVHILGYNKQKIKKKYKPKDSVSLYINIRLPILEIAKRYNLTIRRNKSKCPFHKEKEASLVFYPFTNSFYCWGCKVGGDVITLIQKMETLKNGNG